MELVTKEYLEDNIKTYDTYRGLDKIGVANGIATLDANGLVTWSQIPQLGEPNGIATLDSNGTVPASQLDLTSVVTVTPSITSSDTGAYSVGSVTVNNTTVDLYGRDTPVTVTPGPIQSTDPDAYLAGTIVANGVTTDLYGKDTTYQVATASEAGLVKIGNNNRATGTLDEEYGWHPVQLNNDNQAYVHVSSDAELWRKLYPTDFFIITPVNSDNDNFYGCRIFIPKIIKFFKISYCSYSQAAFQDLKQKSMYNSANGCTYIIAETDKAIYKTQNAYFFLEVITEKGHFDLVLQITPTDLTKQTFNATII